MQHFVNQDQDVAGLPVYLLMLSYSNFRGNLKNSLVMNTAAFQLKDHFFIKCKTFRLPKQKYTI